MKMPGYKNWNKKLDSAEFVRMSDFVKSMYQIHNHNSSVFTKAELERLAAMKCTKICGEKMRFPDDGKYVNLSWGFYADALSDLSIFEEAEPLFKCQLRNVLRHALAHDDEDDAFNRIKFERKYNLRWCEGTRYRWIIFFCAVLVLLGTMIAHAET